MTVEERWLEGRVQLLLNTYLAVLVAADWACIAARA
jgi:hypothetical protein